MRFQCIPRAISDRGAYCPIQGHVTALGYQYRLAIIYFWILLMISFNLIYDSDCHLRWYQISSRPMDYCTPRANGVLALAVIVIKLNLLHHRHDKKSRFSFCPGHPTPKSSGFFISLMNFLPCFVPICHLFVPVSEI